MSQPPDYSAVIQTMPWAFGAVTVMFIYMRWERIHRQDQEYQKELRSEERGREMAKEEKERLVRSANLDKQVKTEQVQQDIGGGYIVLEMSEEKKALFHDVLKGFEDYARLKGYEIRFSVDTGQTEKIAFKFTIMGSGITVSTQQVSRDLQEYIRKVENGDLLDDIPILLPFDEHQKVLLTMRNRINFLHTTLQAQSNVRKFYEEVLQSASMRAISQGQTINVLGSGSLQPANYSAINSSQIAQGRNTKLLGNSSEITIAIGETAKERMEHATAIRDLYYKLYHELKEGVDESIQEKIRELIKPLEKAQGELEDEPEPDRSRIQRWLLSAKNGMKGVALGAEAVEAAKKLWELFGLGT